MEDVLLDLYQKEIANGRYPITTKIFDENDWNHRRAYLRRESRWLVIDKITILHHSNTKSFLNFLVFNLG